MRRIVARWTKAAAVAAWRSKSRIFRERGEILAVLIPDCLGIFDTQDSPHGNGVVARAEPFVTCRKIMDGIAVRTKADLFRTPVSVS
jgi:hypothetical protein